MGRPTKLNAEVQEKILSHLRAGCYLETAAAAAGIHRTTLFDWLAWGRKRSKQSQIYVLFVDAVEKAQAQAELRDIALIGKAAESQWQAAAWRLERKFPDKWGRREHHEVTGSQGGPVRLSGDVEVLALLERLAKGDT